MTTPYSKVVARWQQRDGDEVKEQSTDEQSLGQMLEDTRAIHARILARLMDKMLAASTTTANPDAPDVGTP